MNRSRLWLALLFSALMHVLVLGLLHFLPGAEPAGRTCHLLIPRWQCDCWTSPPLHNQKLLKYQNGLDDFPKPRYASQSLKHRPRPHHGPQSQCHRRRQHHRRAVVPSSTCLNRYVKSVLTTPSSCRVMTVKRRILGQERGARGSLLANVRAPYPQRSRSQSVIAQGNRHRLMRH